MKINGIERGFFLSVGAVIELSALCPDGDINRLPERVQANTVAQNLEFDAELAVIMNKGYEAEQRRKDPKRKVEPLTKEDVYAMRPTDIQALEKELSAAYTEGMGIEMETEPVKEKGKKKPAKKNTSS